MASLADVETVHVRFYNCASGRSSSHLNKSTVSISFKVFGVTVTLLRDADELVHRSLKRAELKLLKVLRRGGKKKKHVKTDTAVGKSPISISLPGTPYETETHAKVWSKAKIMLVQLEPGTLKKESNKQPA